MAEITTISGYKPENLGKALDIASSLEINALVFKGMATAVHDRMLEIYSFTPPEVRKVHQDGNEYLALEDLDWDLYSFNEQRDNQEIPSTIQASNTVIEMVRPGESINMHTDVMTNGPGSLFFPRGYGMSINLVGCALFKVVRESEPVDFDAANSSEDFVADIKAQVSTDGIEDSDCDEALLFPGDVILWRQPFAHKVSLIEPFADYGTRSAIALIREDLVSSKFPVSRSDRVIV